MEQLIATAVATVTVILAIWRITTTSSRQLRAEFKEDIAELRGEVHAIRRDMATKVELHAVRQEMATKDHVRDMLMAFTQGRAVRD